MAVVGVFAFNFTVTLPLLAKFTFHGGAGLYSWFLAAMGAGAVVGGLATAFRSRPSTRLLACIGLVFGAAILAVALVADRGLGHRRCSCRWGRRASRSSRPTTPPCSCGPTRPCAAASCRSTPSPSSAARRSGRRFSATSATSPARGVALVVGGVATLVASIPLFVLGARQRRQRHRGPGHGPGRRRAPARTWSPLARRPPSPRRQERRAAPQPAETAAGPPSGRVDELLGDR